MVEYHLESWVEVAEKLSQGYTTLTLSTTLSREILAHSPFNALGHMRVSVHPIIAWGLSAMGVPPPSYPYPLRTQDYLFSSNLSPFQSRALFEPSDIRTTFERIRST